MDYNEEARKALKRNDWNLYRIEAIGNRIRTFINGIPCTDLLDDRDASGFIALQVHSIPSDKPEVVGTRVAWKNVRILTENPKQYASSEFPHVWQVNMLPNSLNEKEKQSGWKLLFDGSTTNGWRGAHRDSFPEKGWLISNGLLTVLAATGGESTNGGDIVTMDEFSNFEFTLEFKITEGANSGIKYFVTEAEGKHPGSAIGLEYQILDDEHHPDAKLGNHDGSRTLSSLYDLIKAQNKRTNAIGEWNRARIISNGKHVEHWLNGFKVLEYERGSEEFLKLVSESKYKDMANFGLAEQGHILLQDHGNEVSFRSIKIRTW